MKETSLATGTSEWAVKMARMKKTSGEGGCNSPNRRRPNRGETQCLDDFEKCALRRIVHTMYVDGENVTLDTVTAAVQEKMDKAMSRSTIRKQLLQIGFKSRKVNSRKLLTEKLQVVAAAYFVFQLQAVGIFTPYIYFFRVSLISLCLKTFRGVARSKPILGGLIYFYRLEIANKRNGVYLRLSN